MEDPRRSAPRVIDPLRIPVFWDSNGNRKEGFIVDVGHGGCFLNTAGEAELNDEILLEIPEPPKGFSVLRFPCVVANQDRRLHGFGLRFKALEQKQLSAVEYFIERSTPQPDRRDA